jgi:RNA polymerase-binding protein DksA
MILMTASLGMLARTAMRCCLRGDFREKNVEMLDLTYFEQMLHSHRKELLQRLGKIENELEMPADPDAEERATEREDDEVLEGVGQAGLNEIRGIDAALKRIEDGTYGTCASCGEGISEDRLRAIPYAVKCRNCAH